MIMSDAIPNEISTFAWECVQNFEETVLDMKQVYNKKVFDDECDGSGFCTKVETVGINHKDAGKGKVMLKFNLSDGEYSIPCITHNAKEKYLVGRIDDDELKLRYASSDIYISASTNEHCPVPTFEAMACGKPLVLSELESHNEIISASKAGLTFSFSDVKDLCQKVEEVYENKIEYSNGAKNFIVNHSLEEFCKRIEEIYNKVLK